MNSENDQCDRLTSSNFLSEEIEDFPPLLKVKQTLSSIKIPNQAQEEISSQQITPSLQPNNKHCYIWTQQLEKKIFKFLDKENVLMTEANEKQDKYFEEKRAKIRAQILMRQENQDQPLPLPLVIRKKRVSCIITTNKFSSLKNNI